MDIQKWFEGKIHSIDDPEKLGRVQVEEVLGHSVGKYRENPDNLFWSHVLMSPASANAKGVGMSPHGLTVDSKVLGFKINDARKLSMLQSIHTIKRLLQPLVTY